VSLDVQTLPASPGWHSVAFVSDLHLCEQSPLTLAAFEQWLAQARPDALFVLGDLFEVWIGDEVCQQPAHARVLAALKRCAARSDVFFMAGNRDFLLGPDALAAAGMRALSDPCRLDVFGQRLLLSHGDALCLDDQPYQAFRRTVRQADWQQAFLARPLEERANLARRIREESQGRKEAQPDLSQWADVDNAEASQWLHATGAQVLVHGHTHRPAVHQLPNEQQRIVLTDWDADHAPLRGEALWLSPTGWRHEPVLAASDDGGPPPHEKTA
jgi:UDP-2,3-diacylglucosamine hydrolase